MHPLFVLATLFFFVCTIIGGILAFSVYAERSSTKNIVIAFGAEVFFVVMFFACGAGAKAFTP